MVTEWFLWLGATISDWFATLLPSDDAPSWFKSLGDQFNVLLSGADGLGVWVGWSTVTAIILVCVSIYTTLLIVKAAMRVWSYVPFVGGAG